MESPRERGKVSLFAHAEDKAGTAITRCTSSDGCVQQLSFCIQGEIGSQFVSILVDPSCMSYNLVRSDLVDQYKIDSTSRVRVKCCHGDVKSNPTATVKVTIDGVDFHNN